MKAQEFKPAWWLPGPHLPTIWPTLCRRPIKDLQITRERFELPDGDFIDLDWVNFQSHGPIVLLLHGLEGSIKSPYIKGMLHEIQLLGWRGVVMHFRSCSGELNRLSRTYHSGETQDVALVVDVLSKRDGKAPMAAIGFSLGGNVLLKWLGETGADNPLQAAVAVSVPFELAKAAKRMNCGFSKLYQWRLLRSLQKKFQRKIKQQSMPLSSLPAFKTLRDFDDQVTAPLHGFKDADDYYTQSSSRQYLGKIKVPTLLIQAKDDPFMTADLLPTKSELSPQVIFQLLDKGGHVGFVTGCAPWNAQYWLEKRAPEFLKDYLCVDDSR